MKIILQMFLISILFMSLVINASANMTEECRQIGYDLENNFRSFVLINKSVSIPHDEKSMNQYCNKAKAIPKRMKQFKKCLYNKFSKQIINLIVPNLTKAVRGMCVHKKKDAIRNLQCLKSKHRSLIDKCFNQYSNQLKYASEKMGTIQQVLPLICCGYLQTKQCIKQSLQDVCNEKADTSVFLSSYADAMGKEMIGVACSKHSSGTQCEKQGTSHELGVNSQLNLAAKHKFPQYEREFILMPFIRATERMIKSND